MGQFHIFNKQYPDASDIVESLELRCTGMHSVSSARRPACGTLADNGWLVEYLAATCAARR